MSLQDMMDRQRELTERVKGRGKYPEKVADRVLALGRAIIHEAVELEGCFNWKWWKKEKDVDWEHVKEEAIDILHFTLQVFNELDMDAKDVYEEYVKKMEENHARQDRGY